MPQPRVPTNLLKLRGADKKNPARMEKRGNEPKPTGPLGSVPKHLTANQKKCWRQLVKIAPPGVFADCDSWAVEIASVLMAEFREDTAGFNAARLARLDSLLGRFGIVPADRSRVMLPIQEEKNRFDFDDDELSGKQMVFSCGKWIEHEFPPRKTRFDDD